MAVPSLPTYAKILVEGYGETPDYGVIRSEMDGLAKQRPRWSKKINGRTVKVFVGDRANKRAFDDFVDSDLDGGAGWFNFVDPVDRVAKQGRFVGGKIQWSTPGVVWIFEAQLETLG